MNSCELVTFISTTACLLSKNCSEEELSILAAVFTQLGDTIATILVQEEFCSNKKNECQKSEEISTKL